MNYVTVVQAPTTEPMTVAEARVWARIDDDDETQDAMLQLMIIAARERAEEITGRCFATRQIEYRMDKFPDGGTAIELPFPPVLSLDYIQYLDGDGALQTLSGSPTAWTLDAGSIPARVKPLYGNNWPGAIDQMAAVRIGYTAGYANISDLPKSLRIYLQARVATFNEFREQLIQSGVGEIPRDFCDGLLDGLRVNTGFV